MCLNPVTIINPSKYVSLKYRDRFLLQVPCNNCAECQEQNSRSWLFRAYYEFLQCAEDSSSNYVYFDTLTYSEDNLPRLSNIASEFPDYPCFRSEDVTLFLKRLRSNLDRKYRVKVRYFLSSEYGSLRMRPHYHILLFVYGNISPASLSRLVSTSWALGRTDGIPYKTAGYVRMHNVIELTSTATILRACNYVTKYVQKDCYFQQLLDKRISNCDMIISSDSIPFVKSNSVEASKLRQKIKTDVNQFHLQSLHFGELAVRDIDLNKVMSDGYLLMPSLDSVKCKVPVPMYYKRKIFYERYVLHKMYGWQLNELGLIYNDSKQDILKKCVADRFRCLSLLSGVDCNPESLADYVLNYRGRFRADVPSRCIQDRLKNISYYNYVCRSDKENVGCGVSPYYLGNSKIGYSPLIDYIPLKKFIADYVIMDDSKESILQSLYNSVASLNKDKQEYHRIRQRLTSLYKTI